MSLRDLEPLDADIEELFDAERQRPMAAPEVRQRVASRVHATLGLGGLGGAEAGGGAPEGGPLDAAPPAAGPSGGDLPAPFGAGAEVLRTGSVGAAASGSLFGAVWAKPLAVGLATLALGGGFVAGMVEGSRSPAAPETSVVPVSSLRAVPAPSAVIDPERALPEPKAALLGRVSPPPAVSAAPAPPRASADEDPLARRDESLAAERQLLDAARRSVAGGRSGEAFDALARHAREFPRGRLSEEREGLWIQALISAGRLEEARQRAGRFKSLYPRSMLLPALEEALGTIP